MFSHPRYRPSLLSGHFEDLHAAPQRKSTTECRIRWISAISRVDMTEIKLVDHRVSGRHFVTGAAARSRPKLVGQAKHCTQH